MKLMLLVCALFICSFASASEMSHQLRIKLHELYERSLEVNDSETALEEVRTEFLRDLEKLPVDQKWSLQQTADSIFQEIEENRYFGKSFHPFTAKSAKQNAPSAYLLRYQNKRQLLESLISRGDNVEWYNRAHIEYKTINSTTNLGSLGLKIPLGDFVDVGVEMQFARELSIDLELAAEGLHPAMRRVNGSRNLEFDFIERDRNGNPIMQNGKAKRRHIYFECRMNLQWKSQYQGSGEVRFFGLGGGFSRLKDEGHVLTYYSRKLIVPEVIGEYYTTPQMLAEICEKDFPQMKISNKTILNNLNDEMKDIFQNARFHHPTSVCTKDTDCYGWFNQRVSLNKIGTTPRCVEVNKVEKFFGCQLRGKQNANCTVRDASGKRISSGSFEYICDKGLSCVQTQKAEWFPNILTLYQHAVGKCLKR
jgi:hypothetical protein